MASRLSGDSTGLTLTHGGLVVLYPALLNDCHPQRMISPHTPDGERIFPVQGGTNPG